MPDSKTHYLAFDDFARRFALRSGKLMWFLGAGASAAAGIPTAMDMVWEFKQRLFVSQRRTSLQAVSDLSNPIIRDRLQTHIDSLGRLPRMGYPDEYAALFEEAYPNEADRRAYLDSKMAGSKPSFGHLAIATLMRAHRAPMVWTTNFDALIADACAKIFDTTSALTTADLDAPELAINAINEERWPVEVKLHGDFRSRRLKNTADELREQDARLRQILVDSCRRFGLVIAGYSGRDESIMETFEEVLDQPGVFPSGLFWLQYGDGQVLTRVSRLIKLAKQRGFDATLVRIGNFDETLRDLVNAITDLDTTELDSFADSRRHWSSAPKPIGKKGWPVVRLNALPIIHMPTACTRVDCGIGGTAEVRDAVKKAGSNVIAVRSRSGVLAFGSDSEIRETFEPFGIDDFDLYALDPKRQRYDSAERGLLRESLTTAMERNLRLDAIRHRRTDLLAPSQPSAVEWLPLKQITGTLVGKVNGHPELGWREGIGVRLDWAGGRLWMLFEPRIVFDGISDDNRSAATSFARERTVRRYNGYVHRLLEFWSDRISMGGKELRALGIGDGIDAVFRISHVTGYSRRVGA